MEASQGRGLQGGGGALEAGFWEGRGHMEGGAGVGVAPEQGRACERVAGSRALQRRRWRWKMAAAEPADTQLMLGVGLIGEDEGALPRRPAPQFSLRLRLRLGPGGLCSRGLRRHLR